MSSHRKSTQYETTDSLTYSVPQFSNPNTPRKLLSDKKRDPKNPDVLWRLKVYPSGNGTPGFLALYIDIPSKHALPDDWSCAREITFTLHHPTDPSKSIFKRTNHVFNDEEPDWGYNQIIPVIALNQRGFLHNDTIKVSATFRPIEETPEEEKKEDTPHKEEKKAEQVPFPVAQPKTREVKPQEPRKQPTAPVHQFNDQEDCRVIIEGMSQAGCCQTASEWRPFSPDADKSKFEWRLLVCPHSGAESISAYIDVRPKDVRDEKWEEMVSAAIIIDHPNNPGLSMLYPFTKVFKAAKSRKGFPLLSLMPILAKGGFLDGDKLSVTATAQLVAEKSEKPKKPAEALDAVQVQVHGLLSYDDTNPTNCKIVSAWRKLEGLGRWRSIVYPVGTAENEGFVSAAVAFQPSEELSAVENWSLRVLARATAASRPGAKDIKDDSDAYISMLNAKQLIVPLGKVIARKTLTDRKEDYLSWDPECPDDDTLRVNVVFRTCGPSGPKNFVNEQLIDMCLKDVEIGVKGITDALKDGLQELVAPVDKLSGEWNTSMKEMDEAFKKQLDVLAKLGTVFDHKDQLDLLNRRLAALNEEKDSCTGKGLPVEDLNAKELEMRSTLKKLLLIQTTGAKPVEAPKNEEDCESNENAEPDTLSVEVPKSSVDSSEMLDNFVALLDKLRTLLAQCERAGALSRTLCGFREGMEKYMADVQKCIADESNERAELVQKEKSLNAQLKEVARECKILRGDDSLLNSLSPEEVTKYVDFVMEAVGQVAVAKYLTKQ